MPSVQEIVTYTEEQIRRWQELFSLRRKSMGLTQTEMAAKAGLSQTFISSIERGPHVGVRALDLLKATKAYGIEPNEVAEVLGLMPDSRALDSVTERQLALIWESIEDLPDEKLETFLTMVNVLLKGLNSR